MRSERMRRTKIMAALLVVVMTIVAMSSAVAAEDGTTSIDSASYNPLTQCLTVSGTSGAESVLVYVEGNDFISQYAAFPVVESRFADKIRGDSILQCLGQGHDDILRHRY